MNPWRRKLRLATVAVASAVAVVAGRQAPRGGYFPGDVLGGSRLELTLGSMRCVLAALLRLEEPGNTVASRASSSADCTASALHRGQCLRLVGHTVTVDIDATERAGEYISGTRDARPYRVGTRAHTRTGIFRGVLSAFSALFGSVSAFAGFTGTSR